MLGTRFDPDAPLYATSAFNAGESRIEAGDAFDWRARGMTELEALALFSAGLLAVQTAVPALAPAASVKQQAARPARR